MKLAEPHLADRQQSAFAGRIGGVGLHRRVAASDDGGVAEADALGGFVVQCDVRQGDECGFGGFQ